MTRFLDIFFSIFFDKIVQVLSNWIETKVIFKILNHVKVLVLIHSWVILVIVLLVYESQVPSCLQTGTGYLLGLYHRSETLVD